MTASTNPHFDQFDIHQGAAVTREYALMEDDLTPIDLTGATYECSFTSDYTAAPKFDATGSAIDAVNGTVRITVAAADTVVEPETILKRQSNIDRPVMGLEGNFEILSFTLFVTFGTGDRAGLKLPVANGNVRFFPSPSI